MELKYTANYKPVTNYLNDIWTPLPTSHNEYYRERFGRLWFILRCADEAIVVMSNEAG